MSVLGGILGDRIVPLVLGLLLQTTAIALLGLIAGRLLQRHGPIWQSAIYRATFVTVLVALAWNILAAGHLPWGMNVTDRIAPAVASGAATQDRPAPVTMAQPDGGMSASGSSDAAQSAPAAVSAGTPAHGSDIARTGEPAPPAPAASWLALAGLGIWLAGVLGLTVRQTRGHFALAKLAQSAAAIESGPAVSLLEELTNGEASTPGTTVPLLRIHASVAAPFLAGARHPVIYLPSGYEERYAGESLRAILAHELAHAGRHDCAWFLLARLTTVLLWPHPLVWLLEHRLAQTSEEACDAAVLACGCPANAYAASLLALAEQMAGRRDPAFGVGISPVRSSVGRRIQRILDRTRTSTARLSRTAQASITIVGFIAAGSAVLIFCPSTRWHPVHAAVAAGPVVYPAPSWTLPADYTSHFILAQQKGWSMAQMRTVPMVERPEISLKTNPSPIPLADIALMKDCGPFELVRTRFYLQKTTPVSLRTKIEKVLAKRPHYFFAEYRMAEWYAMNKQMDLYHSWRERSLADAPAILAGRIQYRDGRPIPNLVFAPTVSHFNTDSASMGRGTEVAYSAAVTDADGCYYIPVYKTLCWIGSYYSNALLGAGPIINKLGVFDQDGTEHGAIDKHVGLLPPMILHPYIEFSGPISGMTYPDRPVRLSGNSLATSWQIGYIGATNYEVSLAEVPASPPADKPEMPSHAVSQRGTVLWTGNTVSTNIAFDGKKPALRPGRVYELRVQARYKNLVAGNSLPVYFTVGGDTGNG